MSSTIREPAASLKERWRWGVIWLAIAAVLLVVMAMGIKAASPSSTDIVDSYFPHELGTTWVYDSKMDGADAGQRVERIVSPSLLPQLGVANAYLRTVSYEINGNPVYLYDYYARDGSDLDFLGERDNTEFLETKPGLPVAKLSMTTPGTEWEWSGTTSGFDAQLKAEVVDREDAEVAGTTLRDCLRTKTHYDLQGDQIGKVTLDVDEVLCPGVGTVSRDERAKGELISYETELELHEFHSPDLNLGPEGNGSQASESSARGGGPGIYANRSNYVPEGTVDASALAWSDSRDQRMQFPPAGRDGLMVTAEEDGSVRATDTVTGADLWHLKIAAPVLAAPVVAGDIVYVAGSDKTLLALDISTGAAKWTTRFDDVVAAAPLVVEGSVIVPTEDQVLHSLDAASGREEWAVGFDAPITRPPALAKDLVVVASDDGSVTALSVSDGEMAWSEDLQGSLGGGPAVSDGLVVATDNGGTVAGFDAATGNLLWSSYVGVNVLTQPAVGGGEVVVAPGGGEIRALAADDGRTLWARNVPDFSSPPLIVGDGIVVLTSTGTVRTYSAADGRPRSVIEPPLFDNDSPVDAGTALAVLGDDLVFSLDVGPPWPATSLFAYRLDGPDAHGIAFSGEIRDMPTVADIVPPVLVDENLLVAGRDKVVWWIPPTGRPEELLRSDSFLPFVEDAGELVLTQDGSQLVALSPQTKERVWEMTMGDPYTGTRPTVSGDQVIVPLRGVGIAAVDRATGDPEWLYRSTAVAGASSPLVLSGGDVVYGVEDLVKLDGNTGDPVWKNKGITTFSPLAADDDRIFVAGIRGGEPSAMVAFDAVTGEEQWSVPFDASILVGPSAGNGVVVAIDASGVAAAWDEETGRELWTVDLGTPPDGSPVIVGDRVAFSTAGRKEDIYQRESRVSVHDLMTGRYEGSFDPGGPSFGTASFGASDGILLVHADTENGYATSLLEMVDP